MLTCNDSYSVYASATQIGDGAQIATRATQPAVRAFAPASDRHTFTPIVQVQVFASRYPQDSIVISAVLGQALEVDLTRQANQAVALPGSRRSYNSVFAHRHT